MTYQPTQATVDCNDLLACTRNCGL